MPLTFTQTLQQKWKSIKLSKEHFYNTKHLKFNTFVLLVRCFSNLWPPLSQEEFKSTSLSVFVLEVVLPIQKHSRYWIKVCIRHCFRIKYSELFSYNCRAPSEFSMFHGKVIKPGTSIGRSSVKDLAWKFSKPGTYAEYDVCHGWFSSISLKLALKFSEQLCQRAMIFSCSGYSQRNECVTQGLNRN